MTVVFADTQYWIAMSIPGDPWAGAARRARLLIGSMHIATTEFVLSEYLSAVCGMGPHARRAGVMTARALARASSVSVIPASAELFEHGLALYERRPDKGYSHVDCTSMVVMRELGIEEVLTGDIHFAQEGFAALMRS